MNSQEYLSNYYQNYDEENRLLSKYGQVEYITTMKYIEKYLQAGMRTFRANIKSGMDGGSTAKRIVEDTVLMGNASTKRFAQMFVPIATYYKALADKGLL